MTATTRNPHQLIADCQGLVHSLAAKIRRSVGVPVDFDDLVGYGQVGLAEAAEDFDPSRGVKFSTFAYYRVRGAIFDGLSKMAWFRTAPARRARYERAAGDVLQLENAGGDPDDSQDVTADGRWFGRLTRTLAVAYLSSLAGDDPEEGGAGDVVDPDAMMPSAEISGQEIAGKLHELVESLPPQSALMMRMVYFEGYTLQETGEVLGISKGWASRLHARALESLAQSLRGLGVHG